MAKNEKTENKPNVETLKAEITALMQTVVDKVNLLPSDAIVNNEHISQIVRKCSLPGALMKIKGTIKTKSGSANPVDYSAPVKL